MLGAGFRKIDELALNEGQFAIDDGGTDGARDGGEHVGGKVYTRKSLCGKGTDNTGLKTGHYIEGVGGRR